MTCIAGVCILQLGCIALPTGGAAALPMLGKVKGPLPKAEAQAAMRRIDAARDEAQCAQAVTLWQQGKSAESSQLLQQVLERNADQPVARRLMADLALEAGRVEEAERLLVDLVKDHPEDEAARAALAWLYESQGREPEAQALFQQLDKNFSPEA